MKLFKLPLVLTVILTLVSYSHSQGKYSLPEFKIGKTYKFILFDESEIIGKVLSVDSVSVKIQQQDLQVILLSKENIFSVSADITPSQYGGIAYIGAGTFFLTNNEGYYGYSYGSYSSSIKTPLSFQLAEVIPLSENKGLRIDFSYSHLKRTSPQYNLLYNPYERNVSDIDVNYYTFTVGIAFGTMKPKDKIVAYGFFGAGIHHENVGEYTSQYYSTYDSTLHTNYDEGRANTNLTLNLGGSVGLRFSKTLGLYLDAQYIINTYGDGFFFLFYPARGYIPIRAGLMWTLL